jgi:beta-glucosidase
VPRPGDVRLPLTVDQRGLPRENPCDIGAFEHQAVSNTSPPTIAGTTAVGETLTCNTGTWSGSGLTYTLQWQRDGTAIAGATNATYLVQPGDEGQQLDCVVTDSGSGGQASATSKRSPTPPPSQTPPTARSLRAR